MSVIIKMVEAELNKINHNEHRDDRIKFDPHFIFEKKGLFFVMWMTFVLTIIVMLNSEYFNRVEIWLCTLLFLIFNGFFVFHINPSYHLRDVDKISWRNCYTGEWYREIAVPKDLIYNILNSNQVSEPQKTELNRLMASGSALRFIDLIDLSRI